MMRIKSMPKGTLAEMIRFIAENESLSSVERLLSGSFTVAEVKASLRELADVLTEQAFSEGEPQARDARSESELSSKARQVMASLTPAEERKLMAAFGMLSE